MSSAAVVFLCVSAELTPGAPEQGGQSITRLSIALTVDRTKVVIDPETHEIREELRPTAEITRLTMLAKAAAGFVPARGDFIVVEAESFDKAQAIQRREQLVPSRVCSCSSLAPAGCPVIYCRRIATPEHAHACATSKCIGLDHVEATKTKVPIRPHGLQVSEDVRCQLECHDLIPGQARYLSRRDLLFTSTQQRRTGGCDMLNSTPFCSDPSEQRNVAAG